jgi:hypothetical protein
MYSEFNPSALTPLTWSLSSEISFQLSRCNQNLKYLSEFAKDKIKIPGQVYYEIFLTQKPRKSHASVALINLEIN